LIILTQVKEILLTNGTILHN